MREWEGLSSSGLVLDRAILGWLGAVGFRSLPTNPTTPFPQAVVYEAPGFQGRSWEVSRDIYNLQQPEDSHSPHLASVGSLQVLGGW